MSNKIHLGNTKILANESAEAGTEVITPNRSGTLALLTDIDGSEGGSGSGDWYTKAEIDSQQAVQDLAINNNAEDIKDNTDKIQVNSDKNSSQDAAILLNSTNINNNKIAIQTNSDEIDKLSGALIYKGSVDATKTPAPVDARVGDMWINKYNPEFPNKYYTVTGWGSITGSKFDDRLIKTETDWDRIENSTSSSYLVADDCIYLNKQEITNDYIMPPEFNGMTAGPLNVKADVSIPEGSEWSVIGSGGGGGGDAVDAYTKTETDTKLDLKADKSDTYTKTETDTKLDLKADKSDTYTKTATDTLLDSKANVGDSYTKSETYSNVEVDAKLFTKADKETTYTKDEVDTIVGEGGGGDADFSKYYTKEEVDGLQAAQNGHIVEIEEEIEAIAPSAFKGEWFHQTSGNSNTNTPVSGHFWIQNTTGNHETDLSKVTSLVFSSYTSDGTNLTPNVEAIESGMLVELFENGESDSYMLGKVTRVSINSYKVTVSLKVEQSIGFIADVKEPGARLKFFKDKADVGESYLKEETYSKEEVDEKVAAGGGGGGGGAGTLTPLKWNNVKSQRVPNKEYRNEKDVPIYVRLDVKTAGESFSNVQVWIASKLAGAVGNGDGADQQSFHCAEHLVPAGMKYKIQAFNNVEIRAWCEADMPVVEGTAGASAQMKSVETRLDKLEKLLRELT